MYFLLNSDLTASTISVTNGTNRTLQINNVKKIGNVCYVNLAFALGASSYPTDYALATFNNITANGRGYLIGYITDEATNISTRELYIESGSNALKMAEYGLNANYSLIIQGCFVTN